jgi:hypothetical protein
MYSITVLSVTQCVLWGYYRGRAFLALFGGSTAARDQSEPDGYLSGTPMARAIS